MHVYVQPNAPAVLWGSRGAAERAGEAEWESESERTALPHKRNTYVCMYAPWQHTLGAHRRHGGWIHSQKLCTAVSVFVGRRRVRLSWRSAIGHARNSQPEHTFTHSRKPGGGSKTGRIRANKRDACAREFSSCYWRCSVRGRHSVRVRCACPFVRAHCARSVHRPW